MQKEIKHTWHSNQLPMEVWEYLTKSELIEQWLGKTDFQPIIGHKFQLIGKDNCLIYCEVLEVKPCSRLSYSWQTNSASNSKPFNTKVVWTLRAKEHGTELELIHNSFTSLEDHTGHNNGWVILGNRLIELLNTIKK